MSMILVVEPDGSYADLIATALREDGLLVEVVAGREEALRSAAVRAPNLVLASGTLPEAETFLGSFSRSSGGPGAIALVPVTIAGRISPQDLQADGILGKPFSEQDLLSCVRSSLGAGQPAVGAAKEETDPGTLTSADIFGDVLAEVEAEVRAEVAQPPVQDPKAEIERKLEQTLSGVLPDRGRRSSGTGTPAPPAKKARPRDDIDDLLDMTLSSLEIPRRKKTGGSTPAVAPVAPTQQPVPAPQAVPSQPTVPSQQAAPLLEAPPAVGAASTASASTPSRQHQACRAGWSRRPSSSSGRSRPGSPGAARDRGGSLRAACSRGGDPR